jgi:hypothetical protein
MNKPSKEPPRRSQAELPGFLLGVFFDPEDDGDIFLRNAS